MRSAFRYRVHTPLVELIRGASRVVAIYTHSLTLDKDVRPRRRSSRTPSRLVILVLSVVSLYKLTCMHHRGHMLICPLIWATVACTPELARSPHTPRVEWMYIDSSNTRIRWQGVVQGQYEGNTPGPSCYIALDTRWICHVICADEKKGSYVLISTKVTPDARLRK